jgi:outer membrane protein OmpA-like peptidoglycan-associated protein
MIRPALRTFAALAFACIALPAFAQEPGQPDAEGCKPSPVLTRMPGCSIYECTKKEFDSWDVIINKDADKKSLEGSGDFANFICPATISQLQIQRNAEAALRKSGYTIIYSGKHPELDYPVVTAQKGAQWISVQTSNFNEFATYEQTTVLVKEMAQELTATAQAMSDAIAKSGKLDVYGITFATGQATITPTSNQVLSDVLAVLTANADWKLRIEGHTDNVGDKAANLKLSNARAAAVAAWLTGKGIDAARLSVAGLGDTQPVADNATEDGRARNRRVVLVKQ